MHKSIFLEGLYQFFVVLTRLSPTFLFVAVWLLVPWGFKWALGRIVKGTEAKRSEASGWGLRVARAVESSISRIQASPNYGLITVILAMGMAVTTFTPTHIDSATNQVVSNFLNLNSISGLFTETSFFVVMAVGVTLVIITGGIDLSVGAIYALAAVSTVMALRAWHYDNQPLLVLGFSLGPKAVWAGLAVALGVGLVCGILNGTMVVKLKVHPFIITLGTMWIFRGIAFVVSQAESILAPDSLTSLMKGAHYPQFVLDLVAQLEPFALVAMRFIHPVPLLILIAIAALGTIYLTKTVAGRNVFAVGGNLTASVYSGVNTGRVLVGVYALSGLAAGLAAFMGCGYYGAANCGDAQGYVLYVIASAVVGGVSLVGGRGTVLGATLGALLIILIKQSISFLNLDQNYQWIIIGAAIVTAVVLDRYSSALSVKRLASSQKTGGT